MEKNLIEILEPLTEDDVKVQYCDGTNCLHDCPPIGPCPQNITSLISKKGTGVYCGKNKNRRGFQVFWNGRK